MNIFAKDLDQGIETGYFLTVSDAVSGVTGSYFDGKKQSYVSDKG